MKPIDTKAQINIVPQQSVTREEIFLSERESDSLVTDSQRFETRPKFQISDYNESLQISEIVTEELSENRFIDKEPSQQLAKPEILPNKSVEIRESVTNECLSDLLSSKEIGSKAQIEIMTHDAKIISEVISSLDDEEFIEDRSPITSRAKENVTPQEGLIITEIIKNDSEEQFLPQQKLPSVTPRYRIEPTESIQTSEVIAEDRPGKFYPELVVATEIATKSFIEQKSYITHETNTSELEEMYEPNKLPPTQMADIAMRSNEYISISEMPIQDSETLMTVQAVPALSNASDSITTLCGLTTQTVSEHTDTNELKSDEIESKQATVDFSENQSFSTAILTIHETESKLNESADRETSRAKTSFSSLVTSETMQPFIHEREQNHEEAPKPFEGFAEPIYQTTENLIISEVQPVDSTNLLTTVLDYKKENIFPSFNLQQSKEISLQQIHDKEAQLIIQSDRQYNAEKIIDTVSSILVTAHEISEKERDFKTTPKFTDSFAKKVPTEALKSAMVQETIPTDSIEHILNEELVEGTACTKTAPYEQTTVIETIPYDNLDVYNESLKPSTKTADTVLQPNNELIVTEVLAETKEINTDTKIAIDDQIAKGNITETLKTVLVHEVFVASTTEQIPEDEKIATNASMVNDECEQTIIEENLIYEGLQPYDKQEIPVQKTADAHVQPSNELVITEIISELKEDILPSDEVIAFHSAKSIQPESLKSIIVEMVLPSDKLDLIEAPVRDLSIANLETGEFVQTTIEETVVFENLNDYKTDKKPLQSTAETSLLPSNEVIVTQVESQSKEVNDLNDFEMITQSANAAMPDILKSIKVSQTLTTESVDNILEEASISVNANIRSGEFEQTTTQETIIYEGVDKYTMPERPDEKRAGTELQPNTELIVTEVIANAKESDYTSNLDLTQTAKVISSEPFKSIVVEEVTSSDGAVNLKKEALNESVAVTKTDEFEPTTVSETLTYEDLQKYTDWEAPTGKIADSDLPPITEIVVTEVVANIKETEYTSNADLTQTAKSISSHTLKSVVVEEVLPSDGADMIKSEPVKYTNASQTTDEFEQTTVSETVSYEGLQKYNEWEKPTERVAERELLPLTEVQVTEVIVNTKEKDYTSNADLTQVARTIPTTTMKSVIVEEVLTSNKTTPIVEETTSESRATPKTDELEQTTVSEMVTYEGLQKYDEWEKPAGKIAESELQPHTELIVTEVIVNSKEKDYHSNADLTQTAKSVSDTMKSIIVEEVMFSNKTSILKPDEVNETKASAISDQFEQTTVSEMVTYEGLQKYNEWEKPTEKVAETELQPFTELVVTEVIAHTKEKNYTSNADLSQTAKSVPSSTMKSVIVEEVLTSNATSALVFETNNESKATAKTEEFEQTTVSEMMTYEGLQKYNEWEKPTEKLAETELQPLNELVVTEVIVNSKEKDYTSNADLTQTAKSILPNEMKSVIVEEVLTSNDTSVLVRPTTTESKATAKTEEFEQMTVSEMMSYEDLQKYNEWEKPSEKVAETELQPYNELVVTEVIANAKEKDYTSNADLTATAKSVISGTSKSVIVEEVLTSSEACKFVGEEAVSSKALSKTEEFEQTTVSEMVPFEGLQRYNEWERPIEKVAEAELQPHSELVVTEVIVNIKEKDYTSNADLTQVAKSIPSGTFKSVIVEEVSTSSETSSLVPEKPAQGTAVTRTSEFEQTTVSDVMTFEGLQKYNEWEKPTEKVAESELQPHTELVITEVMVNTKEKDYTSNADLSQTAKPVSNTLKSIIVEEVLTSNETSSLGPENIVESRAMSKTDEFEQTTVSETIVYEDIEKYKEWERPSEKKAGSELEPLTGLVVTEVIANTKEKDYNSNADLTQVAKTIPSVSLKSVNIEEVYITDSTKQLKEEPGLLSVATSRSEEFDQTTVSETITYESLDKYNEWEKPNEKIASKAIPTKTELIVTEVVANVKEREYNSNADLTQTAARVSTDTMKSITIQQVLTSQDTELLKSEHATSFNATVQEDNSEQTTVTETIAYEDSQEYDKILDASLKTAHLRLASASNVLPVQSEILFYESNDALLETVEHPSIKAKLNVDSVNIPIKTIVTISESTSNILPESKLMEDQAETQFVGYKATSITEIEPNDSLNQFKNFEFITKSAKEISSSELIAPITMEITPQNSLGNAPPNENIKSQKATQVIEELVLPIQTDTISDDSVKLLQEFTREDSFAINSIQQTHKVAQISQPILNDFTDSISLTLETEKKATETLDSIYTVKVSEVFPNDDANVLSLAQKPKEQYANITDKTHEKYQEVSPIISEGKLTNITNVHFLNKIRNFLIQNSRTLYTQNTQILFTYHIHLNYT